MFAFNMEKLKILNLSHKLNLDIDANSNEVLEKFLFKLGSVERNTFKHCPFIEISVYF